MQYILSIDSLITGIVSFVFGIIVLSNNKKSIINQTGFLLTFATAWWAFCYWQWLTVYDDKEIALFWTRMLSIGSTMIPLFYFHWIISLLNLNKQKKRIVILFYIIVLFFLLFSFSPLFIQNVKPINYFSFWPQAGILYTIYLICVYIGLVIYSLCLLFKHYNKSIGLKHTQLKYVIIGSILGFGGGATNFFLWYNINILPLGNFLVILYPILFSYAILRHRLMDITVIIRKTTVYFFTIISYLSIVLFAIYITSSAGNIKVNWIIVWMAFSVAAILLALFDNIKNFFTRLANKYFFSDIVDYQKTITDLAKKLPNEIKLYKVVNLIIGTLINTIKLNSAGVLLFNSKTSKYEIIKTIGFDKKNGINLITNTFLINYLKNHKQLVAAQELEFLKEVAETKKERTELKKLAKDMDRIEAGLCLPLFSADNLIGIIVLGNKLSNDAYSKEDLEMLEIVANQASISIYNARLYKEVQDFNKNLQKKVNKQTKDIKDKTERLRKLLTMRSEFLNITSHQLRTPVSAIKGVLSMIQEGSMPKEKEKRFLNLAFQRTVKLNEIINDILDASAIDSGKFDIQFDSISIEQMLKEIYNEKNQDNLNKKIKFILNLPKKPLPKVFSNKKYLRHILLNLINNAFQYTIKGSIVIKAETEKNKIIIKIIDTGIGIGKDDIPKLFQKFGRAKNAISTYTDGSGLGLFIIKKIINEHEGAKVYIEKTEINKGSTFVLEFPITK